MTERLPPGCDTAETDTFQSRSRRPCTKLGWPGLVTARQLLALLQRQFLANGRYQPASCSVRSELGGSSRDVQFRVERSQTRQCSLSLTSTPSLTAVQLQYDGRRIEAARPPSTGNWLTCSIGSQPPSAVDGNKDVTIRCGNMDTATRRIVDCCISRIIQKGTSLER